MIQNIIFDIGRVLVDFHPDKAMRQIGIEESVIPKLLKATVLSKWWAELDRGFMDEQEVIGRMLEECPAHRAELERFFAECGDMLVEAFPYSESWVKELKAKGKKVYLLSNYPAGYYERHKKASMAFAGYVDGEVISAFVKLLKPDPKIYLHLLEKYGLKAEECIFIDDRQDNVDAACALGIKGILFTGYEDVHGQVEALL